MKRTLIVAAAFFASIVFTAVPASSQAGFSISFGDFYVSLGPYGDWVYVDDGVYAWRPGRVVHGWMPYAYGRWVWSSCGWYWVSEEPWSWAAYHYGRWHYDDWYGWVWIPGYDWAPAWVEWRYGPEYVGWAPLGPYALFSAQRGIRYSQAYRTPHEHWTFVTHESMTRPDVYRYRYRGDDIRRIYGASRYTGSVRARDGVVESRGPDREYVERRGNLRIGTADVVDVNDYSRVTFTRQGDRERIDVYRPQVIHESAERSLRPDRVMRSERRPSIDSRYLDRRMRPDARDDDRLRETVERESVDGERMPAERTHRESMDRERRDTRQPEVHPNPAPAVRLQEREQRGRQEVRPAAPRPIHQKDPQPGAAEPPKRRDRD